MIRLSTRRNCASYPIVLLALFGSALDPTPAEASDGRSVTWRMDLGTAQAEARARNLPLWIQFTGPWCVNCRRMERGTFVNPAVISASTEQFVPVKLRSDEYEQLALSLGLSSLPSTVIVKPTGEVIDKWEGYGETGEFLVFLEETLTRDGRSLKTKPPEVALASYDPVGLVDKHKLIPGQITISAIHDGFLYRFSDEAARIAFKAHPEKYAPANHGECPVRQVENGVFEDGQPQWGVIYKGHLFLCSDASERAKFIKNPERYANTDLAERHSCPHCWRTRQSEQLAQAPGRASTAPPSTAAAPTRRSLVPPPSAIMEAVLTPVMRLIR